MVKVGGIVTYFDHKGRKHDAIVTAVWGPEVYDQDPPAINLAYVSPEENETDPFGRQIKRDSSVVHKKSQTAHGNYWVEAQ